MVADEDLHQTALHHVAIKLMQTGSCDRSRYGRCLKLLLTKSARNQQRQLNKTMSGDNCPSINVNAKDKYGNSALHYAAMSGIKMIRQLSFFIVNRLINFLKGVENAVIAMVKNGAYLGLKNLKGETPIKWILPSTMKTILDTCIRLSDGKVPSHDFSITFDYFVLLKPRRLLPVRFRESQSPDDVKISLSRFRGTNTIPTRKFVS